MSVRVFETEEDYVAAKKAAPGLIVVKFGAAWCMPCRKIAPKFAELAAEYPAVLCIDVDVDKLGDIFDVEGVHGVPTFKFFKDGMLIDSFAGANATKLVEFFEKYA